MNSTDFFVNPLQTVQFLSVFTSITILGDIFYNEKLLTKEAKLKPIPIVNVLCDYLNENNDSSEIIALGHKLLNNNDLYGSTENETIHLKYVDAMFDNIIASTVFAKFVNTFGYLSAIVNSTNNLTLSFVKRKIVQDLKNQRYLNEDGTISSLSHLTITRVLEKLIFPLFPQPKNDMKIIDADYIYAQAGLMLTRIARINPVNISFDEYITLSQTVETTVFQSKMDQDGLKIFQLPALLYYSYKKKEVLRNKKIQNIITSDELWNDAFNLLFSDLNVTFDKINKIQEENPEYQFYVAVSAYKNRTKLAEETYRKFCPLNESDYPKEVNKYKYYYSNCYCKTDNKLLPNINEIFDEQNKYIAKKYFLLEKELIREAFGDDLIKLVDQENVTVHPLKVRPKLICGRFCYNVYQKLNSTIDLFGIRISRTKPRPFALIRNENNMTLLSADIGLELFKQKLKLEKGSEFIVSHSEKPLKSGLETFVDLASNIAKPREKKFLEMLKNSGYDSTTGEQVIQYLSGFIPFYHCFRVSHSGIIEEIGFTCIMDAVTMIPLVGQVSKVGLQFAKAAVKPLLLSFGTSMKTFVVRQSITLALKAGIGVVALEGSKEFSKIITRAFFKDVGVTVLRTLDPGIELSYMLGNAGAEAFVNCLSILRKIVPSLDRVVQSLKNFKHKVAEKVAGTFEKHSVFVNSISSNDGYGIRYIRLETQNVELRSILGYKSKQPVVQVSGFKSGKKIYQKLNLESGKPDGLDLELRNDILKVVPPPLAVRLQNLKTIGLSGRGKLRQHILYRRLHNRKHLAFKSKEKAASILMLYMDKDTAENMLSQYVFEGNARSASAFAKEWIRLQMLPEWSKDYKLNDVKLFETLRYKPYLESVLLSEEVAVKRIIDFYGEKYIKEIIAVDPKELFHLYVENDLHDVTTFEDYYAIGNWLFSGSSRLLFETPEACRMKIALFKLAFRQFDGPETRSYDSFTQTLYAGEKMHLNDFLLFKEKKAFDILDIGQFFTTYLESSSPIQFLKENTKGEGGMKIFYEITLDSPYFKADVYKIFPSIGQEKVVLPPGIQFSIEKVARVELNGEYVHKVWLKNVPVSRAKWLAQLTNNIKSLQDWETNFYLNSVLNDFDVSLLG